MALLIGCGILGLRFLWGCVYFYWKVVLENKTLCNVCLNPNSGWRVLSDNQEEWICCFIFTYAMAIRSHRYLWSSLKTAQLLFDLFYCCFRLLCFVITKWYPLSSLSGQVSLLCFMTFIFIFTFTDVCLFCVLSFRLTHHALTLFCLLWHHSMIDVT